MPKVKAPARPAHEIKAEKVKAKKGQIKRKDARLSKVEADALSIAQELKMLKFELWEIETDQ
jgi:hypothetical protein